MAEQKMLLTLFARIGCNRICDRVADTSATEPLYRQPCQNVDNSEIDTTGYVDAATLSTPSTFPCKTSVKIPTNPKKSRKISKNPKQIPK